MGNLENSVEKSTLNSMDTTNSRDYSIENYGLILRTKKSLKLQCYSFLKNNFLKYILLIMLLQLYQFPTFVFLCQGRNLPPLQQYPNLVHVMVHVCKFFDSSFPILFLTSPCILYLPIMLLNPCTFPPILSLLPRS